MTDSRSVRFPGAARPFLEGYLQDFFGLSSLDRAAGGEFHRYGDEEARVRIASEDDGTLRLTFSPRELSRCREWARAILSVRESPPASAALESMGETDQTAHQINRPTNPDGRNSG